MNDTRPEGYIAAFGTATPAKVPVDHFCEVAVRHRKNRNQPEKLLEYCRKFTYGTGIKYLNFHLSAFHKGTEREGMIKQGKPAGEPGPGEGRDIEFETYTPAERGIMWEHIAFRLAEESATKALANWGGDKDKITHIVSTATTGWHEPGIASHLVRFLGLSLNTCKIELNFNGCFAGLSCLRTARDIVRSGTFEEPNVVLVVGTEVTSVQYNPDAKETSGIIALSLFTDGSASYIVAPEGDWKITSAGNALVPDSKHLLGMRPFGRPDDDPDRSSYYIHLHPKISPSFQAYFTSGPGQPLLEKLLEKRTQKDKLPEVAVHPGGPRILQALEKVLDARGFEKDVLEMSYRTLQNNGNLGAACILFVLENVLTQTKKDDILVFAFGPGVTVEHATLLRVGNKQPAEEDNKQNGQQTNQMEQDA